MKKEVLLGIIVGLVAGIIIGYVYFSNSELDYLKNQCMRNNYVSNLVSSVCINQGKNRVEFAIDVSDKIVIGVNSQGCYDGYKEKFGNEPLGICLLEEVRNNLEDNYISEYDCICWN